MASLRPAKCYRKIERPYTRKSTRKPRKSYIKGVPYNKIVKYVMGNATKDFPLKMVLIAEDNVQIRHNALEAARMAVQKTLSNEINPDAFMLRILKYPHHVLRENPLATGAGADRFSTGMRLAFGKPIGTAAQVKKGDKVILVATEAGKEKIVRKALKIGKMKFPSTYRIEQIS